MVYEGDELICAGTKDDIEARGYFKTGTLEKLCSPSYKSKNDKYIALRLK